MKLKKLWKRIKAHIVNEPPQPIERSIPRPPQGVEMGPGQQDQEFVIRLADGTYFAGLSGLLPGAIERTVDPERASRFPNRWAALQAATIGPVFANAAIVPFVVQRRPASLAAGR
ncbi:MAG TPA: hypothetical protein VL498_06890 [Terracidiphilus sp.]|jgi:hypothetical protein|nr:hypothetical protein [Terracidiphilus sp.]